MNDVAYEFACAVAMGANVLNIINKDTDMVNAKKTLSAWVNLLLRRKQPVTDLNNLLSRYLNTKNDSEQPGKVAK